MHCLNAFGSCGAVGPVACEELNACRV